MGTIPKVQFCRIVRYYYGAGMLSVLDFGLTSKFKSHNGWSNRAHIVDSGFTGIVPCTCCIKWLDRIDGFTADQTAVFVPLHQVDVVTGVTVERDTLVRSHHTTSGVMSDRRQGLTRCLRNNHLCGNTREVKIWRRGRWWERKTKREGRKGIDQKEEEVYKCTKWIQKLALAEILEEFAFLCRK